MARIIIEFDTASETLADVVGRLTLTVTANHDRPSALVLGGDERSEVEQLDAGARQDAEPGERQAAATKFRRTQDEIARGLTVEQAKAERASAGSPTPSSPSTIPESSEDPFAESPSPPTSAASPGTTAPSLEDLRAAMKKFLDTPGKSAAMMNPILKSFPRADGSAEPLQAVTQMDPSKYGEAIAALEAA